MPLIILRFLLDFLVLSIMSLVLLNIGGWAYFVIAIYLVHETYAPSNGEVNIKDYLWAFLILITFSVLGFNSISDESDAYLTIGIVAGIIMGAILSIYSLFKEIRSHLKKYNQ